MLLAEPAAAMSLLCEEQEEVRKMWCELDARAVRYVGPRGEAEA